LRLKETLESLLVHLLSLNSSLYIGYLRKKGVEIGEGTRFFGNVNLDLSRPRLIHIGRNVSIAQGVSILTHGYEWVVLQGKNRDVVVWSEEVVIGDNVFIGLNSVILKGVHVGRDSIIGAGSIVTRNVPPNSVAAGNPCKVLKTLDQYYDKTNQRLLNLAQQCAHELKQTGAAVDEQQFWTQFLDWLQQTGQIDDEFCRLIQPALANLVNKRVLYREFREVTAEPNPKTD
jgi:acetyltransferase-like isoleucine patch superfamily enzyme